MWCVYHNNENGAKDRTVQQHGHKQMAPHFVKKKEGTISKIWRTVTYFENGIRGLLYVTVAWHFVPTAPIRCITTKDLMIHNNEIDAK